MAYKSIDAVMEAPEGPGRDRSHLAVGGVREGIKTKLPGSKSSPGFFERQDQMQMLTKTEAEDWLPHTGLERDKNGDLGYRHGSNLRVIVPLPDKPYRIPYLANLLLTGAYEKQFVESLLWMTDWGAAGEINNRVGFAIVQSLRGDSRPLIEAPAHLCQPTQQVEAQSLLVVAMLMGWDAYFIPTGQRYFVFNSNDEFIDVVSNDTETHERFLTVLAIDWNGREG